MADRDRHLGVFDATMLVMGGIVGSGIFVNPSVVANLVHTPGAILGVWALGGVIALAGAFVYAELAARLPKAGGVYAYMRDAFHPAVGFMYGWATLLLGQTGGIAAIAVAFARYFRTLVSLSVSDAVVAVAVIAVVSIINCVGMRTGNAAQRACMLLKIAAIASIVLCGLVSLVQGRGGGSLVDTATHGMSAFGGWGAVAAALTPVTFAYSGWTTASYVSAELKHPARDLSRALIYGMLGVVALYLAINAVCILVLGAPGLAATKTPAAAVMNRVTGNGGATILSVFVVISTFGLLTQLLFTVPRLYQAMAADGLFFRVVAYVSPRGRVPTVAIVLQAVAASVLALTGTYESIMSYVTGGDFFFYGMAGIALIIFVRRGVGAPSYRVPGGNIVTVSYVLACVMVMASAIGHDPKHALTGLLALAIGLPSYVLWRRVVARSAGATTGAALSAPAPGEPT